MTEIKIIDIDPNRTLDIVHELRSQGLAQGIDFEFSYHQAKYDNDGWNAVENRHAKFRFADAKYATLFALRYAV